MIFTFQTVVFLTVSGWVLSDHFDEGFHHEHENIFHTPFRERCMNRGKCVALNDCPHLRERAAQGDNEEIVSIVRDFGCGFRTVVRVCCADNMAKPPRELPAFMHHIPHLPQIHFDPTELDLFSSLLPEYGDSFDEPGRNEGNRPQKKVPNWHDTSDGFAGQGNFDHSFPSGRPTGWSNGWNQDSHSGVQSSHQGFSDSNKPNNPGFHGSFLTPSLSHQRPSNIGTDSSYIQGISGGDRPATEGFSVSGSSDRPAYQGFPERPGQSGLGNQGPVQFSRPANERPSEGGFERPLGQGFGTSRPGVQSFGNERPQGGFERPLGQGFGTSRPGVQSFGNERPSNSGLNRPSNYDIDYNLQNTNINKPSGGRPGSKRPTNEGSYNGENSYGSSSFTNGGANNQRPDNQRPNQEGSKKRPTGSGSNKKQPNRRLLPDGNCGTEISDKIIGGEDTGLDEFPWMALLHFSTRSGQDRGYGCGGSLINERYVLTAAHCIKGPSLPQNTIVNTVRLGEYDITKEKDCMNGVCSPSPIDAAVEEIIVHPEYKPNDKAQHHDIALIRLRKKVPFSTYVSPICIPRGELMTKDYSGKQLVVAGWGKTSNGAKGQSSSTKQKVSLPYVTLENCKPFYDGINIKLRNTQMCAGGEKAKDSCQGDSGGPLMSNEMISGQSSWFVTGIVSFGPEDCGVKNIAGVYTKVSQYVDWILENMKE